MPSYPKQTKQSVGHSIMTAFIFPKMEPKYYLRTTTVSYQLSNNQNLIATSIGKLQRDNILIVSTNMEDIVNTVEK
jgi:hypothetical protein